MFPSFHPHSPLIINMSDWPKAACSKVCGTKQHEQKKKKKKKKREEFERWKGQIWTGYEFPWKCIQCITTSVYRRQTDAYDIWEPSAEPKANFTLKPYFSCDLKMRRNIVFLRKVHFECHFPTLSVAN